MAPAAQAQGTAPPWRLLDFDARVPAAREGRSGIVFMKLQDDPPAAGTAAVGGTVSVFIDGTYQASLPKASWSHADVCPGMHSLGAVKDKTILSVAEGRPSGQPYELAASTTSYFQLAEDAQGAPRLEPVAEDAAMAVVANLPRAAHTISRLQAVECVAPAEAPPLSRPLPAVVAGNTENAGKTGNSQTGQANKSSNYTLRYSAFFDFDAFQVGAQHRGSQAEIDQIVQQMRAAYQTVQHIEIFGYADPTGTAAYNLNLSRKRADTVSRYLAQAGFASTTITAKGLGATNLKVHDCASRFKAPAQILSCNEPNRRVELVVHGQARN